MPAAPVAFADAYPVRQGNTLSVAVAQGPLANDSDGDGDPLTAELYSWTGNANLEWNNDGSFTLTPNAGFLGDIVLTYRAYDGALYSDFTDVTISVTTLAPSSPTDSDPSPNAVTENTPSGTQVGITASSTDPEGGQVTYSLSDNAGGRFTIDPYTGVVSVADGSLIDYESSGGSYTIKVRASDGYVNSGETTCVVAVTNAAPDDPTDKDPADNAVAEGVPTGTPVGIAVSATDPAGGTVTYTLTDDAGGRFVIDSNTGVVRVASGSLIDSESSGGSYTIKVQASDGVLASSETTFVIAVTNLPPTATDDSATTDEETPVTLDVLANDSDPAGPAGALTIVGVTQAAHGSVVINADGTVTYTPEADFFGTDGFSYDVSDGQGGTASANVSVSVNPINDAPLVNDQSFTIAEDSDYGALVGTVVATDVDPGQVLTFAITAGDPDGIFDIDPATGEISLFWLLDYETTPSYSLTVTVSDDADPSLSSSATVLITVSDANDAPVVTDADLTVPANSPIGTSVGLVQASDLDPGQSLTFSIVDGDPDGVFAIDPSTGEITVAGQLDYLATPSYALIVTATDNGTPPLSGFGYITVTASTVPGEAPTLTLSATTPSTTEEGGGVGRFTVTRTGDSSSDLTVYYEIEGSATNGIDYVALPGSVVIPAGQSSAPIDIVPIDDSSPEGLERVNLFLIAGTGYKLGEASSDFVSITDDDGGAYGPNVDIIAFRPQSRIFRPTPVPAASEDTVGAGIRSNGDDDNRNNIPDWDARDFWVDGENDLIEIQLDFGRDHFLPSISYFLKRSNSNVKVWSSATKVNAILNDNDEQQLAFVPTRSLWVEWVDATYASANTTITFEARDAQSNAVIGTPDSVLIYRFTSIVIVFGGRMQKPADPSPATNGIFVLGRQLYAQDGYDVHMFWHGDGYSAYKEVESAVNKRHITQVGIIGFSWGGGATYNLATRLTAAGQRGDIQAFSLAYTAYIDALWHGKAVAETRRPRSSQFHVNFFESRTPITHGDSVRDPPADFELNVNVTEWGRNLTHTTIDDDVDGAGRVVLRGVRVLLLSKLKPS